MKDGRVVSATGASGLKYRRKIELSTELTDEERKNAYNALDSVLERMQKGELTDFRMVIRGSGERFTNGDNSALRGRVKEHRKKVFTFCFIIQKEAEKRCSIFGILNNRNFEKNLIILKIKKPETD